MFRERLQTTASAAALGVLVLVVALVGGRSVVGDFGRTDGRIASEPDRQGRSMVIEGVRVPTATADDEPGDDDDADADVADLLNPLSAQRTNGAGSAAQPARDVVVAPPSLSVDRGSPRPSGDAVPRASSPPQRGQQGDASPPPSTAPPATDSPRRDTSPPQNSPSQSPPSQKPPPQRSEPPGSSAPAPQPAPKPAPKGEQSPAPEQPPQASNGKGPQGQGQGQGHDERPRGYKQAEKPKGKPASAEKSTSPQGGQGHAAGHEQSPSQAGADAPPGRDKDSGPVKKRG